MKTMYEYKRSVVRGAAITGEYQSRRNIAGLLIEAAAKSCDKGITVIRDNGIEEYLSYPVLLEEALKRLGGLQKLGVAKGAIILLVLNDSADFILHFWACVLGGYVPAPLATPASVKAKNTPLDKILAVWKFMNKPVILTGDYLAGKQREIEELYEENGLEMVDFSNLDISKKGTMDLSGPESLAIVQYSSGSTSTPKGVMLTHENLLANLEAIIRAARVTKDDNMLSWMPFHHDMGLIGFLLTSVAVGLNFYVMSPVRFIKKPCLWLDLMDKYRITLSGSPNFGYRLVLRQLQEKLHNWDLSSVRVIFNGAEPISVELMQEVTQKLARYKLSETAIQPVYGMAEACLAVSFPPLDEIPVIHRVDRYLLAGEMKVYESWEASRTILFADEGYPVPGVEIRVMDEMGRAVAENSIGEIQIKGPNVTSGYYNNPAQNLKSFQEGWLKTGDLGYMSKGRLVVTGRIKDVIFVNGQNYYAHDIENKLEVFQKTEGGRVAVCGMHDHRDGMEKVVLFSSLKRIEGDIMEYYRRILQFINEETGIVIDCVVPLSSIPKTTSGKIQRFKMIEEFLEGKYSDSTLYPLAGSSLAIKAAVSSGNDAISANPASNREVIRKIWAEILEKPAGEITDTAAFTSIGGTSVKAFQMLVLLEERLEMEFSHDILIQCRTIEDMDEYIQVKRAG